MELRICVPFNSRNTAWVSFDGRGRVEIQRKLNKIILFSKRYLYRIIYIEGDHVKVTASKFPFPTICKDDQATDWFNSLQNCLHWNKRDRQKSFAVVESHPTRSKQISSRSNSSQHLSGLAGSPRNGLAPISRNDTHSPPPINIHSSTRKSSSSSIVSTSSETGHDEVFGMFCDDDSNSDLQKRTRNSGYIPDNISTDSLASEDSFESDEFDSDDNTQDEFNGWTDEEIMKSRYLAHITKELEHVSVKNSKKPVPSATED